MRTEHKRLHTLHNSNGQQCYVIRARFWSGLFQTPSPMTKPYDLDLNRQCGSNIDIKIRVNSWIEISHHADT